MADELIDVFDENNNHLGIQMMKSEVHKKNLWHRAAHIWIYNSKGEILLQLRDKKKWLFPDMWDISAAGHVGANESPVVSAIREIKEEIGLDVEERDLDFIEVRKKESRKDSDNKEIKINEFYYVYFLKYDNDITSLKLQDGEVSAIRSLPIKKIEEELRTRPEKYAPHGEYWFDVINEIRKRQEQQKLGKPNI